MATLILQRTSQFANHFRDYKIWVNDKLITKLADGEQQQIIVNEGTYQIQAKIDWLASTVMQVSLAQDEVKTIEIGCSVFQDKQSIISTALSFIVLLGSIFFYGQITLMAWGLILGLFILRNFVFNKGKSMFYYFFVARSKYLYTKEL